MKFAGCRAIRSNTTFDAVKTLKIHQERDIIEKGFQQLKNEVGGSRFEAADACYRGKLFVYSLAQALRMNMLMTARSVSAANKNLKMPRDSLRKLLLQLQSIQARQHRTTNAFVLGTIPKRFRDLLALLGFDQKTLPNLVSSRSGVFFLGGGMARAKTSPRSMHPNDAGKLFDGEAFGCCFFWGFT